MSGLQIGKAIKTILRDIDNVYPLVADEGTSYPFIIYRRANLTPSSTKDRYNYKELASIQIIVASNEYQNSIDVAELVRDKMEHTRGIYNELNIGDIILMNADENYIEDAFVQTLTFNIEII